MTPAPTTAASPHRERIHPGRAGGGLPARRAVIRWAVRLFRREWRQQVLAIALLTVAVAGASFGVAATWNAAPSSDATFGSADQLIRIPGDDPAALDAQVAAARAWFGTIDVVGHRHVPVPGRFDPVDVRAQDPAGAYGGPMLALGQGRYPLGPGEIAVTDGVARFLRTGLGARVGLGDADRLVVGIVENPADLHDEFALTDPAHADRPQSVTVLVAGDRSTLEAFRQTIDGPLARESRPVAERTVLTIVALALATVGLLLVSLVAAAGFVVLAHRRLRQLGMLAAMGATRRHLRLVLLVNGAAVGAVAAVGGTSVGVTAWLVAAGFVETAAGHRIDRFDLPWPMLGAGVLLAVATATVAAWWPARAVARTPVMSALSARPPTPPPARRTAVAAAVLLAVGLAALVLSDGSNPLLIVVGSVGTALGVLLVGPLTIPALAAARGGLPVAVRLALADLARYRARAGAALAAISLAVGISAAIVVGSVAAEHRAREAAGLGNLADSQLLIRIGSADPVIPQRTAAELAALQARADTIASTVGASTVIPLDMAVVTSYTDPGREGGPTGHPAVEIGAPAVAGESTTSHPLYVVNPGLLGLNGVPGTAVDAQTDVLTARTGAQELVNIPARGVRPTVRALPRSGYTGLPDSLITPAALDRHGWQPARVGWFLTADHALTTAELATAQDLAASAGLTIESRREQSSLSALRTGATAAGALLALGVLATTVGLIRGESAADLRTLTATGAPRRVRRTLTATTAGALALLGAVLGVSGAYLALAGTLHRDLDPLGAVPLVHLAAILGGLPLLAAGAGWLLAGRLPSSFSRRLLD
ncbi:FtsX-like permease family protein [Micromonospora sp. GCM10011542]|uniref:FtsX-like permease family protein n=1 Tax=Micromonospora sp. GCM10011542 TaxID=3317337 RepID=UPI003616B6C5